MTFLRSTADDLTADLIDEAITGIADGREVAVRVARRVLTLAHRTSAEIERAARTYVLAGQGLHAFYADCAARLVTRLEADAGAPPSVRTEFVACVDASGAGVLLEVPAHDDGALIEEVLRGSGYDGPFVFLGHQLHGPFTPVWREGAAVRA
ncbi:MAG: hypothetical protein H3C62_04615 [Gemmatimonadaceae bacterium]|nr:hypothetical protein [Gemmatimonadaceae bacterium]